MKTPNLFRFFIPLTFFGTTLFSCVQNEEYDTPNLTQKDLVATTTFENLKSLLPATGIKTFTEEENFIVDGYVVSSDEAGNFYKTLQIVTPDGKSGLQLQIDKSDTYAHFPIGSRVFIHTQGLSLQKSSGMMDFGIKTNSSIGRIPDAVLKNYLSVGASRLEESALVRTKNAAGNPLKMSDVNDTYLNTLIELHEVQFQNSSLEKNYYNPADASGGASDHDLEDGISTKVVVRVSQYANFSSKKVASGNGTLRGVLTKFNTSYQLIVRDINDIKLTEPRKDFTVHLPPKGGTLISYNGNFTEDFTSYTTTNQEDFPKYINDADKGNRYWQVKSFSSNKYIQLSANGATQDVRTYFIIPIDFTAANGVKFKTKDGYYNGKALRIYWILANDYTPLQTIDRTKLTPNEITSFALANGTTTGYATNFTDSGVYNFPSTLVGNGYLVFEYTGGPTSGVTTTMQIDDVVIN